MKVLISGYYGFDNIGDEAVLSGIIKGLKQKDPSIGIIVLSSNPEKTTKLHGVPAINRNGLANIRRALKRSDILISGGGSLLQDSTSSRSLYYYLMIIKMAQLMGKKTVVLAQGFGPVEKKFNLSLVKNVLSRCDLITLRDQDSFDAVKSFGLKKPEIALTVDPAALLDAPGSIDLGALGIKDLQKPIIGFAIRKIKNDQEKTFRALAEAADKLIEKLDCQVVFIPFRHPVDVEAAGRVLNYMKQPATVLTRPLSINECLGLIGQLKLLVGMRLHSLIFAAMLGIPSVAISYDPKVESFMKTTHGKYFLPSNIKGDDLVAEIAGIWEKPPIHKVIVTQNMFNVFFDKFKEALPVNFAGIEVDNLDMREVLERIKKMLDDDKPHWIVTTNPEMIVAAQTDRELKDILNSADLRVADGISMVVVSRLKGNALKERVSGIDLMQRIVGLAEKEKKKIFLLGGKPGVAEAAARRLRYQFPEIQISGFHDGFFQDDNAVIEEIRKSDADILFVGLGAAKQEKWIKENLNRLGVAVAMGVGGSFDVLSGLKKRAPKWVQKIYLEWLYRLIKEPWRAKRQRALVEFLRITLFLH